MLKNVVDIQSQDFSKGLNTASNLLSLSKEQSPNMMNVKVNFDGSIEKRLGSTTMNSVAIAQSGVASFNPDSGNTLQTNLIAFWKMDEVSGSRSDTISTNTLSDFNATGFASGIKNQAANFASANSNYLLISTDSLATGDVNFSISTWFYLNSTSTTLERTLVAKRDYPESSDTVLLLHMDGADGSTTFTDSSISAKTVTANGDAQIDTAQFKFGGASGLFDGTGDYISIPDNADWDFGTGDWTIDFWFRLPSVGGIYRFMGSQAAETDWMWGDLQTNADNRVSLTIMGTLFNFSGLNASSDTWTHLAFTRSGSSLRCFVNGSQIGSTQTDSSNISSAGAINIGRRNDASSEFNGWLDEFRIIKGRAAWTASFSAPTSPYSNPSLGSQYEYWLYINTDNIVTFRVSSSGTASNGEVRATSLGSVTTATWYNIVAWHDTGNTLGISGNLSVTTATYASGLRAGSAPFVVGAISNGAAAFMDGRIDETGFWKKALTAQERSDLYNGGSGNTYTLSFLGYPWGSFDFGSGSNRFLTVAAGTGIYASSDLGVNFVTIATDRTGTYQSFERSKNILIATSDAYDRPLYWAGSAGTFMAMLNVSAPLAKLCANFQGFTILMNTQSRKRGFFYEDENSHITGAWSNSFDIPSSADDELTTWFILRGTFYVTTKYSLYRVTYVGGNPDWSFRKIKDWGYVSRTVKVISVKDIGEVACGLSWDRKIRLFDGSDDKIISENVENDNGACDFALDKVSYTGSGLTVSFAEHDDNEEAYKLCVAVGSESTQTTHFINYSGRAQAFYPYSNMAFNTMVMAESGGRKFLAALDRNGFCHMMDSGNLDGQSAAIDDVFDSPLLFEKSPSEVSKSQRIDLYLSPTSSGTLRYLERTDFSSSFRLRENLRMDDTSKLLVKKGIDLPTSCGVYQWRLTSSANTATPWKLNRSDYFLSGLGIGNNP